MRCGAPEPPRVMFLSVLISDQALLLPQLQCFRWWSGEGPDWAASVSGSGLGPNRAVSVSGSASLRVPAGGAQPILVVAAGHARLLCSARSVRRGPPQLWANPHGCPPPAAYIPPWLPQRFAGPPFEAAADVYSRWALTRSTWAAVLVGARGARAQLDRFVPLRRKGAVPGGAQQSTDAGGRWCGRPDTLRRRATVWHRRSCYGAGATGASRSM